MKKQKFEVDEVDGLMLNFVNFAGRYKRLLPDDDGKAINDKLAEAIGNYRKASTAGNILRTLAECIIVCFGMYNINPDTAKATASMLLRHGSNRVNLNGIEAVIVTRWALYEAEYNEIRITI